jgi:formamidopyrimidine-DNA glycosylase
MSGVWLLDPVETRPHTHLTIVTDLGTLQYSDPRRFGWICLAEDRELTPEPERWRRLGPDALADDWTARDFHAALLRSSRTLKELLLDQSLVAGVGNIYASEALFAALLDPRRPGTSVTAPEAALLRRETRRILRASVRHRGTTFSDYRLTNGRGGGFQSFLKVFQKEGEPCPSCGEAIAKMTQGARSTFWCPHCQK